MRQRGIAEGDFVDLTSHFEGQQRLCQHFVAVPFDVLKGNCAAYFPEANPLLPIDSVADKSNQPIAKYIVVTVAKSNEPRISPDRPWYGRLVPSSLAP
jgi:hypothetical protein